jgi:hypothetical protein
LFIRHVADVVVTLECRFKARFADSESQILAMKKFSCSPASGLIAARQNQFFARIAKSDSQSDFPVCDDASAVVIDDRRAFA